MLKWKGWRAAHGFLSRGFSLGFSSTLTCQAGKAPEEMARPIRVGNPSALRDSPDISDLLPSIMSKNPLLEKSLRSHQHRGPWQPSGGTKPGHTGPKPRQPLQTTLPTLQRPSATTQPPQGLGAGLGTPLCCSWVASLLQNKCVSTSWDSCWF